MTASRAILVVLCALVAGCGSEPRYECRQICGRAQECRLLPSPLGISQSNCEQRCTRTSKDEPEFSSIFECHQRYWHGIDEPLVSDAERCGERCVRYANCLEQALTQPFLTGRGSVSITVAKPSVMNTGTADAGGAAGAGGADAGAAIDLTCAPPMVGEQRLDPLEACQLGDFAVAQVTVVVVDRKGQVHSSAALRCEEALGMQHVFEDLPAGFARAQILLAGTRPVSAAKDDDAGAPLDDFDAGAGETGRSAAPTNFCVRVADQPVLVAAGAHNAVTLLWEPSRTPLGALPQLEECDLVCRDQEDNDHDDFTDCNDSSCSAWCPAAVPAAAPAVAPNALDAGTARPGP